MHEKSVSHTRIQDFWGGGGEGGLPENNPDNFLVLNLNSLHFTVIERRSRVRACPHCSDFREADSRGWGTHIFLFI